MSKNIEPKLRKIGAYLTLEDGVKFIIPAYQRAYSWNLDYCDKLWQNIVDFSERGTNRDNYFFGTIIINCKNEDTELELIDGQQRTTTFLLLLKALLIKINTEIGKTHDEESEDLLRGLRARRRKIIEILYQAEVEKISDDPNPTKDRILYENPIVVLNKSNVEQHSEDLEIILRAADFDEAKSKIKPIKYKRSEKNKYSNFFKNFKYFYEKLDSLSSSELNGFARTLTENCELIEIKSWNVEQAINMFNSLNSDGMPLFDSDIIHAQLYAAANGIGKDKEFSDLWQNLNAEISSLEQLGIADINAILLQYMYYVRTVNGETKTDKGTVNVTTPGLRRYFTRDNLGIINNPINTCQDLLKLAKAWSTIAEFLTTKILLKFNDNAKLFLASYLLRLDESEVTQTNIEPIVKCLLRLFTVLELVDIGYSSKNFKIFLFSEEIKLADKSVAIETIEQDFYKHICTNWTKTDIIEELKEYDNSALVYLNEYLFAQEKKVAFDLEIRHDIEHIMPNSGSNLQLIRKDANIKDEEEFAAVVNKLGNKILLEEKINRSIGNEWFRAKVSTHLNEKTGYVDSKYPIAACLVSTYQSVAKPFWTKDDISAATDKASNRIAEFIFASPATSQN